MCINIWLVLLIISSRQQGPIRFRVRKISLSISLYIFKEEAQNEEEEEKGERDVNAKGMTGQNDPYILSSPEMSFITEKEGSSLRYE